MANILDQITVGEKLIQVVDNDPSLSGGTASPLGSIAVWDNGTVAKIYLHNSTVATSWDQVATITSGNVNQGNFGYLPIYKNAGSGYILDDQVDMNLQPVGIQVENQTSRTVPLTYRVPNPGNTIAAADFVLTEGAQTINGNKTFNGDILANGNLTVNGTLTYVNTQNLQISDPLITLNKGGVASSGSGSGIEIEEGGAITGYFKTSAGRNGWVIKVPASANVLTLDQSALSASRTFTIPDANGTAVVRATGVPGTAGQVTFWQDANTQVSDTNLFWDNTNKRLGIGNSAPSVALHVTGNARVTGLSAGPVKSDANGNLSVSSVSLTSEVSGILPIANGGTNLSATGGTNTVLGVTNAGGALEYKTITPTLNQVNVTHSAGAITLSLPQSIHTGASPVFTGMTLSALNSAGFVKNSAAGVLSTAPYVVLTTDVNGILPIANGGTNSSAALNNNSLMYSSGGKIVELGAMTNGQLVIGSTSAAPVIGSLSAGTNQGVSISTGAGTITLATVQDIRVTASPTFVGATLTNMTQGSLIFAGASGTLAQNNANLFWDNTNNRLGLGTTTPSRLLDVNGTSIFKGAIKIADASVAKANFEIIQAQTSTTDGTATTLTSITIPSDSAVLIEAKIIGRRTGGTAGNAGDCAVYVRHAKFKNIGGVVTKQNEQATYTAEDNNAWKATYDVSGTSARIRVTGSANNNVDWVVTYSVKTLN